MRQDLQALLGPKSNSNMQKREVFLERFISGSEQIRCSEALKKKSINWLHGTRSPAMQLMLAKDQTLHPTGKLLQHKIIPLTGELGIGITGSGINQNNISGTSVSQRGTAIAIRYAEDFRASAIEEWEKVSLKQFNKNINLAELVLHTDPQFESRFAEGSKFDWLSAGLYIERLKVIDPDYSKNIVEVKSNLDHLINERKGKPGKERIVGFLMELRAKCDTPPFIKPTQAIRESVFDSFPIILAASNIKSTFIDGEFDEHLVEGSLGLENIPVAFTPTENVGRLQGMVNQEGLNIEVMDFDALRAMTMDHLP